MKCRGMLYWASPLRVPTDIFTDRFLQLQALHRTPSRTMF